VEQGDPVPGFGTLIRAELESRWPKLTTCRSRTGRPGGLTLCEVRTGERDSAPGAARSVKGPPTRSDPLSNRGSADRLPELRTLLQHPRPVGDFDDRVDLVFEEGAKFADGV